MDRFLLPVPFSRCHAPVRRSSVDRAVNGRVNRADTLIDQGSIRVGEFSLRESSDVLQRYEQVTPSVAERRGQGIAPQDPAERFQAPTIAPTLDKRLNGVEQMGIVCERHGRELFHRYCSLEEGRR
jgi:hypothetical protein